jgi:Aspartate/tyrosine/aromatic aminotransferase
MPRPPASDGDGRRFAARVTRIAERPGGGWAIHFDALERRARGEDVILLSIGDHEFATPEPIVEAAITALRQGRHHYTPAAGIPELRRAIAAFYADKAAIRVEPDNIVVMPGAQGGLYALLQCLVQSGDEVLVPEPMYVTYPETVAASGARLVAAPLAVERHFALDVGELAARVNGRTRAVLINTPHNPTGTVIPRDAMAEVVELCRRHGLWLISDEVYAGMVYGGGHVSALAFADRHERIAVVESLSKSCAMTGWRVGWTVTPPDLARYLEHLAGVVTYGLPPFVQAAAVEAMARLDSLEGDIARLYDKRAALVCDALAADPDLVVHRPRAGMFVMLGVAGFGVDGESFARRLLEEAGVSLLPGDSFGPGTRDYVRFSLSAAEADLAEACRRILGFTAALRAAARR